MEAKKELEKWKLSFERALTAEQKEEHKRAFNEFINSLSESDRKQFMSAFSAGAKEAIERAKELIEEIKIKKQLEQIQDIVSFSYIAEHYFGKTRQWLYQRINGNVVNGKPARFTQHELMDLRNALNDICLKIQATSQSIALH